MASAPFFRARLVGPTLTLLEFDLQGGGYYVGSYRLPQPGVYHAELLLLYSDFDAQNFSSSEWLVNVPPILYNYSFSVSSPSSTVLEASDCGSPARKYNAGHWSLSGNQTLLNLLKCTLYLRTNDTSCYAPPLPLISQAIEWTLPQDAGIRFNYLCPVHDYRFEPAPAACLEGAKVCFFGDSHLRYLHNLLVMLRRPDARLTYHHQVLEDDVFSYTAKEFQGFPGDIEERAGNCTHVLVNFGQWPASHVPARPWSFAKYRVFLDTDLAIMAYLREAVPAAVAWVATNPVGFVARDDWRTDAVMDGYAAVARNATAAAGIPLIDAYEVAKAVDDLAYYGGHYVGVVGRELVNVVLNEICSYVPNISPSF